MILPIFQSKDQILMLLQTKWRVILNTLLTNPSLDSLILTNVNLQIGKNVINHTLGRTLQGWRMVRIRAAANVYDQQDFNQTPNLTLVLMSDAVVTLNIEVF